MDSTMMCPGISSAHSSDDRFTFLLVTCNTVKFPKIHIYVYDTMGMIT